MYVDGSRRGSAVHRNGVGRCLSYISACMHACQATTTAAAEEADDETTMECFDLVYIRHV